MHRKIVVVTENATNKDDDYDEIYDLMSPYDTKNSELIFSIIDTKDKWVKNQIAIYINSIFDALKEKSDLELKLNDTKLTTEEANSINSNINLIDNIIKQINEILSDENYINKMKEDLFNMGYDFDDDGNLGEYFNAGKYNNYDIGGIFENGMYSFDGIAASKTNCCQIRDFVFCIDLEEKKMYESKWELIVNNFDDGYNFHDKESIVKFRKSFKNSLILFETKENYVNESTIKIPSAFLSEKQGWIEIDGFSSKKTIEERMKSFKELLSNEDENMYITIVDIDE
jgi:hypothetical protein